MRDAPARSTLEDHALGRTARLVGFVLSTYMNSGGQCRPSKKTIAAGAGLGAGKRAVDGAIDELEQTGYLCVDRDRSPFRYSAAFPVDNATDVARAATSENGAMSHALRPDVARAALDVARRATEVVEEVEIEVGAAAATPVDNASTAQQRRELAQQLRRDASFLRSMPGERA